MLVRLLEHCHRPRSTIPFQTCSTRVIRNCRRQAISLAENRPDFRQVSKRVIEISRQLRGDAQGCKCQSLWHNCIRMRPKVRQVVITAVLALVVAICTPVFVHRHDFDVALTRWMKDQSTENTAVLKEEARKSRWIALKTQIGAGCVAFLLLTRGWFLVRPLPHSARPRAPQAGQ